MKINFNTKSLLLSLITFLIGIPLTLLLLEGTLRLKNMSMNNYEIEMWRYAKELKNTSQDPILGHEHKPSSVSVLQSVEIRTNRLGLRGPDVVLDPRKPSILFLGSSITLGWGVPEKETIAAQTERLLRKDGFDVTVLNAGVGNYNSQRYVQLFLTKLKELHPTDIVVHFFLRDAEILEPGRGNWLLRNSHLAVTLWNLYQQNLMAKKGISVEARYREIYNPSHPGYQQMVASLAQLSDYAKRNQIRIYLAMTPDVHNLKEYPFGFIHENMAGLSKKLGYQYIDLFPSLKGLTPQQVWSMPGDPHPNSYGHLKMAEALAPTLEREMFNNTKPHNLNIN